MSFFGVLNICLLLLSEPIFLSNSLDEIHNTNYLVFKDRSSKVEQKEETLYNIHFEKQFLLKYDNKSCVVIDLRTKNEVFTNNSFVYPYKEDDYYHIFNDASSSNIKFLCSNGIEVWEPINEEYKVPLSEMFNGVSSFDDNYTIITTLPYNAVRIPRYEYFLKLGNRHGLNTLNICTLVAIQIICGFYDTFTNDNFVPEFWDNVAAESVTNPSNWTSWSQSPGAGSTNYDFRMCQYLLNYASQYVNSNIMSQGLNYYQQTDVLTFYLNEMNINYSLENCSGNLADCITQRNKEAIKESINDGYPIIANGGYHSVVAFAYDSFSVYVHTGWGNCAMVPWSIFLDWDLSYQPSSICILPSLAHYHTNNYYSLSDEHYYCSCGQQLLTLETAIETIQFPSFFWIIPMGSFLYNYNYNASFYYYNVTLNLLNQIVLEGNSELTITFNQNVFGIRLKGRAFKSDANASFRVLFYDSNDVIFSDFDLESHTQMINAEAPENVVLNCPFLIRKITIKTIQNDSQTASLFLDKLVFGF